jgi:hypothetical protein
MATLMEVKCSTTWSACRYELVSELSSVQYLITMHVAGRRWLLNEESLIQTQMSWYEIQRCSDTGRSRWKGKHAWRAVVNPWVASFSQDTKFWRGWSYEIKYVNYTVSSGRKYLKEHRWHRKRRVQQFLYCCMLIFWAVTFFIQPLPRNDRNDTHTHRLIGWGGGVFMNYTAEMNWSVTR